MYKLSCRERFVSSSFPDKNLDGAFPPDQIDSYIVGMTMEREVDRSLSDLQVGDRDFLKEVRQERRRKLNCRVMGLNGKSEAGL